MGQINNSILARLLLRRRKLRTSVAKQAIPPQTNRRESSTPWPTRRKRRGRGAEDIAYCLGTANRRKSRGITIGRERPGHLRHRSCEKKSKKIVLHAWQRPPNASLLVQLQHTKPAGGDTVKQLLKVKRKELPRHHTFPSQTYKKLD